MFSDRQLRDKLEAFNDKGYVVLERLIDPQGVNALVAAMLRA